MMTMPGRVPDPNGNGVEILLAQYADGRLSPDADQLARGRAAILTALATAEPWPARAVARRRLLRGWSLAAASAALVLGSGGLVAAESGPGQPFYGLRLAIGALTEPADEPAHDRWLASRLDERLTEVRAAARDGDGRGAQAAIDAYLNTLSELTDNGITDPAILALLQRHHDTLEQLLTVAPDQSADGLQQALDAADDASAGAPPVDGVPHPTPPGGAGESPPATGRP
jgi:hypothetical protein